MKQHIKIVKEFNSWRRGTDDVHVDDKAYPKMLGEALDEVVNDAERTEEFEKFIIWLVDDYGYQEHPIEILKRAEALKKMITI